MRSPQLIAAVLAGFAFCRADPQAGPRPQDPVTVFASRTGIGDSTKTVQVITRDRRTCGRGVDRMGRRLMGDGEIQTQ